MRPLSLSITHILFARRKPDWRLPKPGHMADILTTGGEDVGLVGVEAVGISVRGWVFSTRDFKRVRLRKPSAQSHMGEFGAACSQSLLEMSMTLWRIGIQGYGGGLLGGRMEFLALEAG